LAVASVTRAITSTTSEIYILDTPDAIPRRIVENEQNFVIYLYWSPAGCPDSPPCGQFVYLIEEVDNQIGLYLTTMQAEQATKSRLGQGRPFYLAWHPDGDRIVWHTGGSRRFNAAAALREHRLSQQETTVFDLSPGIFFAPAWSPKGDNWLAVLAEANIDQLHLIDGQQGQPLARLAQATDNQITFSWSPAGDQIAYTIRKSVSDPLFNPIQLLDLETGQTRSVTLPSFRILAFFWSPDGKKLAYLQQPVAGGDWLQWRVYNLETEQDRGYTVFVPSFQMLYVLGSFNQYALSHSLWSPDSRYLVFADRDKQLIQRVWLLDTLADNRSKPRLVDEGTFGVWSWE
jgi:TolB protein